MAERRLGQRNPSADPLVAAAIELLRDVLRSPTDPKEEPGLSLGGCILSPSPDDERTGITLGKNDTLTTGCACTYADCYLHFRMLVSMLTRPGERSFKLAHDVAQKALNRLAHAFRIESAELVNEVLTSSRRRRTFHLGQIPDEDAELPATVRHALGYAMGAMRCRARTILRQRSIRSSRELTGTEPEQRDCEAGIEAAVTVTTDETGRTADDRNLHRYGDLFTVAMIARVLDRPRSTIRNTASGLGLPIRRSPNGHDRLFTGDEVTLIRNGLPAKRRTPRRRHTPPKPRVRDRRRRYQTGAVSFGGDLNGTTDTQKKPPH